MLNTFVTYSVKIRSDLRLAKKKKDQSNLMILVCNKSDSTGSSYLYVHCIILELSSCRILDVGNGNPDKEPVYAGSGSARGLPVVPEFHANQVVSGYGVTEQCQGHERASQGTQS